MTRAAARVWLVRHGPTHARTFVGRTDLPADLSDTARLDRLAAALPDAPVVSSDLLRARATADALARGRPRLPHEPDLREFDYGAWENRAWDEIDDPNLRRFLEDPGDLRAPGGESWNDLAARVTAAIDRLATPPDLIVVCHMGPILTQWARATGLPPGRAVAQPVAPLSLTRIDLEAGGPVPVFADRHP